MFTKPEICLPGTPWHNAEDDLYLGRLYMSRKNMHKINTCAAPGHGQWAWLQWPTKMHYLWLVGLTTQFQFFSNLTDLFLQLAQVPWYFVYKDTTDYFTSCACTQGIKHLIAPLKHSVLCFEKIGEPGDEPSVSSSVCILLSFSKPIHVWTYMIHHIPSIQA